ERLGRGGLVSGAQVFGSSGGGLGLLGVALPGVPVRGGGDQEEQHVDRHRRGGSVLTAAEGRAALDEVAGGLSQGAIVPAYGADVRARGPFEGRCGVVQFAAGVSGGRLREGVQDLADRGDVGGGDPVLAVF